MGLHLKTRNIFKQTDFYRSFAAKKKIQEEKQQNKKELINFASNFI